MSDPIPPSSRSEPPSPFDSSDTPIGPGQPPPSGRSGVRKPLLIGCGVLLVLVLAATALFFAQQDAIVAWVLEEMHGQVEPRLPEDLPEDLRARYQDAFEVAVAAAREGSYEPEGLKRVQEEFSGAVQGGGSRLTVEEVERLTAALEDFPREL